MKQFYFPMVLFCSIMVVVAFASSATSQTSWWRAYGGTDDDYGQCIQETQDGGFIVVGYSKPLYGTSDIYLIRTDSLGDTLWSKRYGGAGDDWGYGVQQTLDGGFVLVATTNSFLDSSQVWLIKTDALGNQLWSRLYGGFRAESGLSVQQTRDAGYIIVGRTTSYGAGSSDVYLIKTDVQGDTLWTKTYGSALEERGYSVQQTLDGGYIVVGYTTFPSPDTSSIYLIKTNSQGDSLWSKTFRRPGLWSTNLGYSVQQTQDEGYIVAGYTFWWFARYWNTQSYLVKTDSLGNPLWTKAYTAPFYYNIAQGVRQAPDGGYIVVGQGYNDPRPGNTDHIMVFKVNAQGGTIWTKTYPLGNTEEGNVVQTTRDGGFIIAGASHTYSPYVAQVYVIKADSLGNVIPHPDLDLFNDTLDVHNNRMDFGQVAPGAPPPEKNFALVNSGPYYNPDPDGPSEDIQLTNVHPVNMRLWGPNNAYLDATVNCPASLGWDTFRSGKVGLTISALQPVGHYQGFISVMASGSVFGTTDSFVVSADVAYSDLDIYNDSLDLRGNRMDFGQVWPGASPPQRVFALVNADSSHNPDPDGPSADTLLTNVHPVSARLWGPNGSYLDAKVTTPSLLRIGSVQTGAVALNIPPSQLQGHYQGMATVSGSGSFIGTTDSFTVSVDVVNFADLDVYNEGLDVHSLIMDFGRVPGGAPVVKKLFLIVNSDSSHNPDPDGPSLDSLLSNVRPVAMTLTGPSNARFDAVVNVPPTLRQGQVDTGNVTMHIPGSQPVGAYQGSIQIFGTGRDSFDVSSDSFVVRVEVRPFQELSQFTVVPNPFIPSVGHTAVWFTGLPSDAEVRIYDLSGLLVKVLQKDPGVSYIAWDPLRNPKVASGVYFYSVSSAQREIHRGKLAVIK